MGDIAAPVTVFAVDDHPTFLETVRAVVTATPGFDWAGGAASAREALSVVRHRTPDLFLIDVNMPGMDGFALARELGRLHPAALVALISARPADELPADSVAVTGRPVLQKELLRPAWLRELWQKHGRRRPVGDA